MCHMNFVCVWKEKLSKLNCLSYNVCVCVYSYNYRTIVSSSYRITTNSDAQKSEKWVYLFIFPKGYCSTIVNSQKGLYFKYSHHAWLNQIVYTIYRTYLYSSNYIVVAMLHALGWHNIYLTILINYRNICSKRVCILSFSGCM